MKGRDMRLYWLLAALRHTEESSSACQLSQGHVSLAGEYAENLQAATLGSREPALPTGTAARCKASKND